MKHQAPLVIAGESDAVAAALVERAAVRRFAIRRVSPQELWEKIGPRLEVNRDGSSRNSLAGRAVFNRFGVAVPGAFDLWRPEDRHYASMESGAALFAALLLHPRVINAPKPHDPSGCGLRSVEQLRLAANLGLFTPPWLVTSRLTDAEAFLERRELTVYRRRSEDIFDFHLAKWSGLPLAASGERLLAPVFLLEGRAGAPVVTTWVAGKMWNAEALTRLACDAPAPEVSLKALFEAAGLSFGQAIWIRDEAGAHVFYGVTGTPQLRFYQPHADEVHDEILSWLGGPDARN